MGTVYPLERPATLNDAAHDRFIAAAVAAGSRRRSPSVRLMEASKKAAFKLNPAERRHIDQIARSGRIVANAGAIVFSAYYIGLELSVAATTIERESNGRNIYGSDPGTEWMAGLDGHLVTKRNYIDFIRPGLLRGETQNGVGVSQLTSRSLVFAADARGGAWNPQHNSAVGFLFMLELVNQTGSVWEAFYHYNGSGPAAEAYANEAVAQCASWRGLGLP